MAQRYQDGGFDLPAAEQGIIGAMASSGEIDLICSMLEQHESRLISRLLTCPVDDMATTRARVEGVAEFKQALKKTAERKAAL